jgi:DNA-binding MarR family transcriptional regulator
MHEVDASQYDFTRELMQATRYVRRVTGTDEPHWLDEEEQEAWLAVATLVFLLPGVLDRQLLRDANLSLFDYMVLSGLSMAPHRRQRMSELAEFANGSLSRLSNVVKRFEQRGWVVREPDPADGRYTVARLTDAGWDVVVAAAPGHVDAVRRHVIAPLTSAQLRSIAAAGRRIAAALDDDTGCAEPPC